MHAPMILFALAAFLLVRNVMGGGDEVRRPPIATAAVDHAATRDADIAFFEERVQETDDSLSYNRLVSLYLQRYRETGNPGDIGKAEAAAIRSNEVARGNYGSIVALASVRLTQHAFGEAEMLARQAATRRPDLADARALLGDALLAMGRYDEAEAEYRIVLEKAPGPAAFARLASTAEIRGNTALAEQFWMAAIDSETQAEPAAWASVQLGHLHFSQGDLGRSESAFERALVAFPNYPHARAGLGRVAAARGQWERAEEHLRAAGQAAPAIEYAGLLGDVLLENGEPEDARRQFELAGAIAALQAANGVRDDLTAIMFALDHGQTTPDVLTAAKSAYEQRPSIAAADTYAWALYRSGNYDEAWTYLLEARETGKRDPQLAFHGAAIAVARGDFASASVLLAELDRLNPHVAPVYAAEIEQLRATVKDGRPR